MINKPPIHISTYPNHYTTNLQFTYAISFPPIILLPLPTQKKNQSNENQTNKQTKTSSHSWTVRNFIFPL